jgi:hypothetical protein
MTVYDSLHSLLDYKCLLFDCDWLGSDLRIGHLRINKDEWRTKNNDSQMNSRIESSLMLRPTVSRPVCLGIKHPTEAYGKTFITVRQL